MKKIIVLTFVAMLSVLCCFEAAAKKKAQKNIAEVTFVTTIDCKNCVKKVEANLPFTEGIKDMKVTLADKTVWIKYDTRKTDVKKLEAAIEKLGYDAKIVTPAPSAKK